MQINDISLLGVAVVVVMMACCVSLFVMVDKNMATRLGRVLIYFALSLVVACLYVMGLLVLDKWWICMLWAIPMALFTSFAVLKKIRAQVKVEKLYLRIAASVLIAMIMGCGVLAFTLPMKANLVIVVSLALLSGSIIESMSHALKTYIGSLYNTKVHSQYMLANGASHMEAVAPSIKRALNSGIIISLQKMTKPVAFTIPALLCGMLLGGLSPVLATVVMLITSFTIIASNILSVVLGLYFIDSAIFDKSGKLK